MAGVLPAAEKVKPTKATEALELKPAFGRPFGVIFKQQVKFSEDDKEDRSKGATEPTWVATDAKDPKRQGYPDLDAKQIAQIKAALEKEPERVFTIVAYETVVVEGAPVRSDEVTKEDLTEDEYPPVQARAWGAWGKLVVMKILP